MDNFQEQIKHWNYGQAIKADTLLDRQQSESADNNSTSAPLAHAMVNDNASMNPTALNASSDYYLIKTKLHQKILSRLNLAAAETMPKEELRSVLKQLIDVLVVEDSLPINYSELKKLSVDLQNEILGLGPLEPLMAELDISEIMVNGYNSIFVERHGRLEKSAVRFNDDEHVLRIIQKIVSNVGRRIDESSPMVDARLPDGSRVNAVIPPIALDGPALSIRRFSAVPLKMDDLINNKSISLKMANLVAALVRTKSSILISGGTGSGKTTLLNVLSSFIPGDERIVTIEDTAELQLQQAHVVRLETRPMNIEGKGEIPMRALVKNSLRMRPDRIVLGEVRGGEVIDMLQAMNTGHAGSLTTVHANTPRDALVRLESLVGMGGVNVPMKILRQQISSAIDIIIQIGRLSDGTRKIMSIQEITGMEGDVISMQEIFIFERTGMSSSGMVQGRHRATGIRPAVAERMISWGIKLDENLFDPNFIE